MRKTVCIARRSPPEAVRAAPRLVWSVAVLSLVLALPVSVRGEALEATTRMLDDGTTIIEVRDETGRLIRDEVVLRNGRHKKTYFDDGGDPQYSVVATGTGSFGIMYYDEAEAPLFKFWHHGDGEKIIQFHSRTFDLIGSIEIETDGAERRIVWNEERDRRGAHALPMLAAFFAGAAITAPFVYATLRKVSRPRR